jgi:hypothetical protein
MLALSRANNLVVGRGTDHLHKRPRLLALSREGSRASLLQLARASRAGIFACRCSGGFLNPLPLGVCLSLTGGSLWLRARGAAPSGAAKHRLAPSQASALAPRSLCRAFLLRFNNQPFCFAFWMIYRKSAPGNIYLRLYVAQHVFNPQHTSADFLANPSPLRKCIQRKVHAAWRITREWNLEKRQKKSAPRRADAYLTFISRP